MKRIRISEMQGLYMSERLDLHDWLGQQDLRVGLLSLEQRRTVEYLLHLALVHSLSCTQYKARIKRLLDDDQDELLDPLLDMFNLLRESPEMNVFYKMTFLSYMNGDDKAFRRAGLSSRPLDKILMEHSFKGPPKIAIEDFSTQGMQALLRRCEPEIKSYIRWFVRRKLSFVVKGNREDPEAFEQDFYLKALVIFRWLYPFRSEVHQLASVKSSLHNAGINEIYRNTTKKRGRVFYSEREGFNNRQVELSALDAAGVDDWETRAMDLNNGSLITVPDVSYRKISLDQMLQKLPSSQAQAINLLITDNPPEEFFDRAERMYNVRVPDDEYDVFLRRLRSREDKQGLRPNSLLHRLVRRHCGLSKSDMRGLLRTARESMVG